MKPVFYSDHIIVDTASKTQQQAFEFIARHIFEMGYVADAKAYEVGLFHREQESSTGLTGGVAIPHCKSATVKYAGVFVVRFSNHIEWETMDEQSVHTAVVLSIPENGNEEYVRMLTKLSRCMVRKAFRDVLIEGDSTEVDSVISSAIQ